MKHPLVRLISVLSVLAPLPVLAQNVPPPQTDETVQLEAFTVTGSNIKGIDTEKTLPVTVVSFDDLTAAGYGTISEFVEALPFSTNLSINDAETGPNGARGDVASINLRNLGAGRTLVLLNGRRLAAYGVTPGTPGVQFVNINAIPRSAVKQVEILRDGASAIYGSDAIGGVVNWILKDNYSGYDASVRYSWDTTTLREIDFSASAGATFNEGKSNFGLFFSYFDRDALYARSRDYAKDADKRPYVGAPWDTVNAYNRRSSSGPYGRFTAVNDNGSGVSVPGVTSGTGLFHYNPDTGLRASGSGPTATYNFQPNTTLIPNATRYNLFTNLQHELSETLELFAELSYYESQSSGYTDSIPVSSGTDGVIIPKTNYYSPVGVNSGVATPRDVLIRNYRVLDAGLRTYSTDADSYRLVAGLRGDLPLDSWTWEAAALYMRGHAYQENGGHISQSLFEQQLALNTPNAFNPFAAPGGNTAAQVDPFVISIWDDGVSTMSSFDAKASGEIYEISGGAIQLAVGGEYRKESMKQRNDPYGLADDVIAQSEQIDVDASRDLYATYTEVSVPLVSEKNRMTGLESLNVRAAVRYESYERFDALKPGVGLDFRPVDWFMVRTSYNEGFRAPTVVELYTPAIGRRSEGFIDPARPGQPDSATNITKRVVAGGNANLKPEESESRSIGVVIEVPGVKGLTLFGDYFRIKQFNQIDNTDAQDELELDADLWAANGGSNPLVIRAPRTPDDITAGIPGVLVEVISTYQNRSLREIHGFDVGFDYRGPETRIGRFGGNASVSYTNKLITIDEQGNQSQLIRNNGNPRFKGTATIKWDLGSWSASISERVTDDYLASTTYSAAGQRRIVDQYWVTNASVGYSFREGSLKGLRLRVGMNNLFNEDPPFYPASSSGYSSDYSDPRGRVTYVEASFKF
ncbi:MAG: TonB-dependent receptor [Opitutaceae bacterium]|nr:TonB-dependent receptor [Cephaloticoccus sp.]MCP5528832.1 TonB-dependent receptor [Opitutaceae bacterium]